MGDRLSMSLSPGRLQIAAALVLLAPFVPMLFQGEEWGATTPFLYFTDHADADLGEAVRQGRRREFAAFGWAPEDVPDPQAAETFERARLDWTEPEQVDGPHAELLAWHRELIRLRRSHPCLTDGRLDLVEVEVDEAGPGLTIRRGDVTVAVGLGPQASVRIRTSQKCLDPSRSGNTTERQ
jgi:maltooligosyltrehalose trehalohydrolase